MLAWTVGCGDKSGPVLVVVLLRVAGPLPSASLCACPCPPLRTLDVTSPTGVAAILTKGPPWPVAAVALKRLSTSPFDASLVNRRELVRSKFTVELVLVAVEGDDGRPIARAPHGIVPMAVSGAASKRKAACRSVVVVVRSVNGQRWNQACQDRGTGCTVRDGETRPSDEAYRHGRRGVMIEGYKLEERPTQA